MGLIVAIIIFTVNAICMWTTAEYVTRYDNGDADARVFVYVLCIIGWPMFWIGHLSLRLNRAVYRLVKPYHRVVLKTYSQGFQEGVEHARREIRL